MTKRDAGSRRWRWSLPVVGGLVVCLTSMCHQPASTPTHAPPTQQAPSAAQSRPQPRREPPAAPPAIGTGRWLYAEQFAAGTIDGFVEGDFSAKRNRIAVKTHSVTRFAVDTRHIGIDWDKLVVIRINGHNSELKRRDDPVLHFVLDRYNQWVVEE